MFRPSFLVVFSLEVMGGKGQPTAGLFVETWHLNWGAQTLQGVRAKTFATGDPIQRRGQSAGGKGGILRCPAWDAGSKGRRGSRSCELAVPEAKSLQASGRNSLVFPHASGSN